MAQNTWINLTTAKSTASAPDSGDHHGVSGGSAASGDFTVSFDSAVVTNLNIFDSLVRSVRLRLAGAGLK